MKTMKAFLEELFSEIIRLTGTAGKGRGGGAKKKTIVNYRRRVKNFGGRWMGKNQKKREGPHPRVGAIANPDEDISRE